MANISLQRKLEAMGAAMNAQNFEELCHVL
jgi:hypothetical protein